MLIIQQWFDEDLWPDTASPPAGITGMGGLHHICCGIGDPGVQVVPQTLHTIDLGVST